MKIVVNYLIIRNVRHFRNIKLDFSKAQKTFILMPNGTGKTTSINLMRSILIGDSNGPAFRKGEITDYKPFGSNEQKGYVELSLNIDSDEYKIKLHLDYMDKEYKFNYASKNGSSDYRPEILDIFISDFTRKFVFDGELCTTFLLKESDFTEETIKNLYLLDGYEDLLRDLNKEKDYLISRSIVKASKKTGETSYNRDLIKFREIKKNLNTEKSKLEIEQIEIKTKVEEFDKELEKVNEKFLGLREQIKAHEGEIDRLEVENKTVLSDFRKSILSIHLLNEKLWNDQRIILSKMDKMKLPREMSEQFFEDLLDPQQEKCICGTLFTNEMREYIRSTYRSYLDENTLCVLNQVKFEASKYEYDDSNYKNKIKYHENCISIDEHERAIHKIKTNHDQKASKKIEEIKNARAEVQRLLTKCEEDLRRITDKRETENSTYTYLNNLSLCEKRIEEQLKKIEAFEYNQMVESNCEILKDLISELKGKILISIKSFLEDDINNELKKVHTFDELEITIEKNIRVIGKSNVSTGQSLSISYIFISSLFKNSFHDLPLIIDSPVNSMDNTTRREIASILPRYFNQLIMFITSSERSSFVDSFVKNYDGDINYITVYKNEINSPITIKYDYETFINYDII